MTKGFPEPLDRLPYGVVHEHIASTDGLVELSRNEAGALLHPVGIQLPCTEEIRYVVFIDCKKVDQYHGGLGALKLLTDRYNRIKRENGKHEDLQNVNMMTIWCHEIGSSHIDIMMSMWKSSQHE